MSFLSKLGKLKNSKRSSKRVGRGYGSGKGGHTSTRGMKGQKSRTGGKTRLWFEGGQTPMVHGMPYRGGFRNPNSKTVFEINLDELSNLNTRAKNITPEMVLEAKSVKGNFQIVKVLSKGSIDKALNLKGFSYSNKAKEKIEAAGGKVE